MLHLVNNALQKEQHAWILQITTLNWKLLDCFFSCSPKMVGVRQGRVKDPFSPIIGLALPLLEAKLQMKDCHFDDMHYSATY